MSIAQALHAFFASLKFQAALVLIFVDFVLGIAAAFNAGTFRLNWIADFAKTDILFKLIPWATLAFAAIYAGQQQLVIPGITTTWAETAVYAAVVAAWGASITKSLGDLGLPIPAKVAGLLAQEHPPLPPAP